MSSKVVKRSARKAALPKPSGTPKAAKKSVVKAFTFIDLFAGIGGFHQAAKGLGGECVFACEIDKSARETYLANHKIDPAIFAEDIRRVKARSDIPDHDILFAGFPCQPFSQSGFKRGFADTRGTLFFEIMRVIRAKKPKAILLENVRHLVNHDNGNTMAVIKAEIKKAGYEPHVKVLKASDFGLPQYRPRVFIVGVRKPLRREFRFPDPVPLEKSMSDIFKGDCPKKIGFTLRVGGKGSQLSDRRNWDAYLVDGVLRRIGKEEGLEMMGYPAAFKLPESRTQAMKQLGNSVAVPVVAAVIKEMASVL